MATKEHAVHLFFKGYVVLPLYVAASSEYEGLQSSFSKAMCTERLEVLPRALGDRHTFDPTGKLSGSVNHHHVVRGIRKDAYGLTRSLFQQILHVRKEDCPSEVVMTEEMLQHPLLRRAATPGSDLAASACCPDAPMVRKQGDKVTHTWHRDLTPGSEGAFLVVGGWVNLNRDGELQPQEFCCVPSSHFEGHIPSFPEAAIRKGQVKGGFHPLGSAEAQAAEDASVVVAIPPGHLLVFAERILHCVRDSPKRAPEAISKKLRPPMLRVFAGAQLHTLEQGVLLYPDLEQQLRDRAAIPIKSGSYLPCVQRSGAFANSEKNKRRAEEWIEHNVQNALVPEAKRRLVVSANSPLRAWPSLGELCQLLNLDPKSLEKDFPDYSEGELMMFRFQTLALGEKTSGPV